MSLPYDISQVFCIPRIKPKNNNLSVKFSLLRGLLSSSPISISFPCVLYTTYSEQEDQYTSIAMCTDPQYWCVALAATPRSAKEQLKQKLIRLAALGCGAESIPTGSVAEIYTELRLPRELRDRKSIILPTRWQKLLPTSADVAKHSAVYMSLVRYLNKPLTKFRLHFGIHCFLPYKTKLEFIVRPFGYKQDVVNQERLETVINPRVHTSSDTILVEAGKS